MTPVQKRQVIRELRQQGLSLRLALDLAQMARATFYRPGRGHPQEDGLRERIRELAYAQVSFGYRRITAVLRRQGWRVNPKRVYRLYRQMKTAKTSYQKGTDRAPLRAASDELFMAHSRRPSTAELNGGGKLKNLYA